MKALQLDDKKFILNISEDKIKNRIEAISNQINIDYQDKEPVFIVVLSGAYMFASDLMRQIKNNCQVNFVKLSSYKGTETTKKVKEIIGLQNNLKGKDLIIVEDIIETGTTMEKVLSDLLKQQPSSIRIASLLLKPDSFKKNYQIDYVGFEIPNDFIVGYGLDYNQLGRNLSDIYIITK